MPLPKKRPITKKRKVNSPSNLIVPTPAEIMAMDNVDNAMYNEAANYNAEQEAIQQGRKEENKALKQWGIDEQEYQARQLMAGIPKEELLNLPDSYLDMTNPTKKERKAYLDSLMNGNISTEVPTVNNIIRGDVPVGTTTGIDPTTGQSYSVAPRNNDLSLYPPNNEIPDIKRFIQQQAYLDAIDTPINNAAGVVSSTDAIPSTNNTNKVKEGTVYSGNFDQAFANARKDGLSTFTWNGQLYGTGMAKNEAEWMANMSDERKAAYQEANPNIVTTTPTEVEENIIRKEDTSEQQTSKTGIPFQDFFNVPTKKENGSPNLSLNNEIEMLKTKQGGNFIQNDINILHSNAMKLAEEKARNDFYYNRNQESYTNRGITLDDLIKRYYDEQIQKVRGFANAWKEKTTWQNTAGKL